MSIKIFGGTSSGNTEFGIDTSFYVKKPYIRTNYIERIIKEEDEIKNQFKIKQIPTLIGPHQITSKFYVDDKFNKPSRIKNSGPFDFKI